MEPNSSDNDFLQKKRNKNSHLEQHSNNTNSRESKALCDGGFLRVRDLHDQIISRKPVLLRQQPPRHEFGGAEYAGFASFLEYTKHAMRQKHETCTNAHSETHLEPLEWMEIMVRR